MSNAQQRRAYHAKRDRDKYKKRLEMACEELGQISCPNVERMFCTEGNKKTGLCDKIENAKKREACWQRYFKEKAEEGK
jgi:hypothetical protein